MAAVARAYAHEGDAAKASEWIGKAADAGFIGLNFIDSDPTSTR